MYSSAPTSNRFNHGAAPWISSISCPICPTSAALPVTAYRNCFTSSSVTDEKSVIPYCGPRFMPSCPLLPISTGTLAASLLASVSGVARCVTLSLTGRNSNPAALTMLRMASASATWTHANSASLPAGAEDNDVQFSAAARALQAAGPPSLGKGLTVAWPLWSMAARKGSGFGSAVSSSRSMDDAPDDSPKTVTLRGSPPKAAMLSCTQARARRWSQNPALRDSSGRDGALEKPNAAAVVS